MASLKDYNYSDFPFHQPVSKAAMETLQQKALEGDSESETLFRKYIISLGMYIAQEEAKEKELDPDYLLEHIDADQLENACYQKSFSTFQNETIHIDTVRSLISTVINSIYTKTLDEKYIKTELYEKAVSALEKKPELYSLPDPVVDGVPTDLFKAVRENEIQLNEKRRISEAEDNADKALFSRLKEFVRDSDMSYGRKLNFLINLTQANENRRRFFCYLFSLIDGDTKTIEETADHFGMDIDQAKKIYTKTINGNSSRFLRPDHHDDPFVISDLNHFLCENEQNIKEREKFEQKVKERRMDRLKFFME